MEGYLDSDLHKLEKGFYESKLSYGVLYFTGEYTTSGDPIVEFGPKITYGLQGGSGEVLIKVSKEDMRKRMDKLKEQVGWLENKLGE